MIKTQFDDRFREIPVDPKALSDARRRVEKDFLIAIDALKGEPEELERIDYYRLLSRVADLDRFAFKYTDAIAGLEDASRFWISIGWDKAAFLCDLKVALCQGYLNRKKSVEFGPLLKRLSASESLQIYKFFLYQFRGQMHAFHSEIDLAKADFLKGLEMSTTAGKKKQAERFRYFIEKLELI